MIKPRLLGERQVAAVQRAQPTYPSYLRISQNPRSSEITDYRARPIIDI